MAFKKREYNYWRKTLKEALFKLGVNPYWFKEYWYNVFVKEENYEAMKATNDVFDEWYSIYKMSNEQVEQLFAKRIKDVYYTPSIPIPE